MMTLCKAILKFGLTGVTLPDMIKIRVADDRLAVVNF